MTRCASARKVPVTRSSVRLEMHYLREGSILRGTLTGACQGVTIRLDLDSDADRAELTEVVRIARNSCFTERALVEPVEVSTRATVNGQDLQLS